MKPQTNVLFTALLSITAAGALSALAQAPVPPPPTAATMLAAASKVLAGTQQRRPLAHPRRPVPPPTNGTAARPLV